MTQPTIKRPDTQSLAQQKSGGKLEVPSASRNAGPIRGVLKPYAPNGGNALEIASGTGQHIAVLAVKYPDITWYPSDVSQERFASVEAWRRESGARNLRAPMVFDASGDWQDAPDDLRLIYLVNLFHLISRTDAEAVIVGAAAALEAGGCFFVYGPFRRGGDFLGDGDVAFDQSLRAQDAGIGYKDLEWIEARFLATGLTQFNIHEMPANNFVVVGVKG